VSRATGGTRARAGTVSLLALTGAQLGQTLVAGWESRAVLATGLGSMAGLLAVVQTPIVSRAFGCRPLGPIGLLQAGAVTALATGASVVVPPIAQRANRLLGNGNGKLQIPPQVYELKTWLQRRWPTGSPAH
jgi:cation-transporting P-type ATPase I